MKEQILKVLGEALPQIDFTSSERLVDDGILDSLSIVSAVTSLSAELGISVPYTEVTAENFNSVDAMAAMAERLRKA